jgi:hypothetical protein
MAGHGAQSFSALDLRSFFGNQHPPLVAPGTPPARRDPKKNPAAPLATGMTGAKCHMASAPPPPPPPAARASPAGGFAPQIPRGLHRRGRQRGTPSFFGKLPNVEPLSLPSQKCGSIFSPHWPVDFCAPKRLVFGFAACGAWICRLRRSYFQCANNTHFTSFGTSSEANPKQHAAVYLILICCSAQRLQGSAAVVGK